MNGDFKLIKLKVYWSNLPDTIAEKQLISTKRDQFTSAQILIKFMNNPRSYNPGYKFISERDSLC